MILLYRLTHPLGNAGEAEQRSVLETGDQLAMLTIQIEQGPHALSSIRCIAEGVYLAIDSQRYQNSILQLISCSLGGRHCLLIAPNFLMLLKLISSTPSAKRSRWSADISPNVEDEGCTIIVQLCYVHSQQNNDISYIMKEKVKSHKPKTLPFKTKSFTKIITNKENIKTQEVQRKRTAILEPSISKKSNNLQSSIRYRKRKQTIRIETKIQELKKITNHKARRRAEDGHLRPAHSVELRKNRFNVDLQENRMFSLSAKKRLETRKRSVQSLGEIVKASFNKTIQLTPSTYPSQMITQSFHQQKRITMPIQLYQTLNVSKKIKSKPNTRRNSHIKPEQFFKDQSKSKRLAKRKKGSVDLQLPRTLLEDRVSDILRLSTSEDKGSIIQAEQIELAVLTDSQDFNLEELRQLESNAKLMHKKTRKLIEGESSNSYFNMMATKIQRFWRQYKTKKILSRHITPNESQNNTIQLPYESLQLYGNSIPERHNTYVSNLEDSEGSSKLTGNEVYQLVIKQIKTQQLQKWDQLIEMVEESIKDNTGTKQLLKRLIQQSQLNKLTLEENTEQILASSHKTKSFRVSPEPSKKVTHSSHEKSLPFMNENSPYSHSQLVESPAGLLSPQQANKPINRSDKLFNSKGIERFRQKFPSRPEEEEDSLETRIAVQKLKQKLVELNNSDHKDLVTFSEQDSPCLRRDRRSLDRDEAQSITSSEEQSEQEQEDDVNPKHRLIKLITQNLDKELVCNELADHVLMQQMALLLKDVAISGKLYRQLKAHIKGSPSIQINKPQKKPRRLRGMRTNIVAVKQYIKSLGDFILNLQGEPLKNLEYPSGPTTQQMLRYMRFYDEEEDTEDGQNQIILTPEVFEAHWLKFSGTLVFPKSYQQAQMELNHQDFLRRLSNIHCRSIFDTLNQNLDTLRNYGQFGKPFPWKKVPNFFHNFGFRDQKQSLEAAIQKTIEAASSFCGLILDKQQYGSASVQNIEYVQQMHQQRLSRTLAQQLIEGQQKWLFYDDQETEILIQIAYSVNQQLIAEVAEFLLGHEI